MLVFNQIKKPRGLTGKINNILFQKRGMAPNSTFGMYKKFCPVNTDASLRFDLQKGEA
jgi:hypothetical protein